MDQVIFDQKLESLRRCIKRVEEKTPSHVSQLIEDQDIQDILVLNLTRAVQLCVDIGSHVISESEEPAPTTMGDVFSTLENLGTIKSITCKAMRNILVLNLTRAVQLCVDIGSHVISESEEPAPTTMGDVFSTLENLGAIKSITCKPMRKAVGFRNIAVHNYDVINWEIVYAICNNLLVDFRRFASEITEYSAR